MVNLYCYQLIEGKFSMITYQLSYYLDFWIRFLTWIVSYWHFALIPHQHFALVIILKICNEIDLIHGVIQINLKYYHGILIIRENFELTLKKKIFPILPFTQFRKI